MRGAIVIDALAKQVWQWKARNNKYASASATARGCRTATREMRGGMGGPQRIERPHEAYEVTRRTAIKWQLVSKA